jgi:hypothetical protein
MALGIDTPKTDKQDFSLKLRYLKFFDVKGQVLDRLNWQPI